MADTTVIAGGKSYKLKWLLPHVPLINVFENPDGTTQEFPDPDPMPADASPTRIRITYRKGYDESTATRLPFPNIPAPPTVRKQYLAGIPVKEFSLSLTARRAGSFLFSIEAPDWKTITKKLIVRYRTIQEVLDDPSAVRRQAVLASIGYFFPAFNLDDPSGTGMPGSTKATVGTTPDPPIDLLDQTPWKSFYGFDFDASGGQTSCVTVNPGVMYAGKPSQKWASAGVAENDVKTEFWAFHAFPNPGSGESNWIGSNPGWLDSGPDRLPSVGDTYLLSNDPNGKSPAHVGIILHVPPEGNGLWITADGGEGNSDNDTQLALIVPRWGLMGEHLPAPSKKEYRALKREPDIPFLSWWRPIDINESAPKPEQNGDIDGMLERIKFHPAHTPNPRRLFGFVNIDDPAIDFTVDRTPLKQADLDAIAALQTKVSAVTSAGLAGRILITP